MLIDSMRALPGRKAVILFSEGFALAEAEYSSMLGGARPRYADDNWLFDSRRDAFMRMLERANQAQIALYTFDAAGLRADTRLGTAFGTDPSISLLMLLMIA